MTFDTTELRVRPDQPIRLTFENPDAVPHNWALLNPGKLETIGTQASKMIADPEAAARHYIPDSPDVLAYTDVVDPYSQFTIYFQSPKQPGRYPYLCTFPGHWMVMNGTMIVEEGSGRGGDRGREGGCARSRERTRREPFEMRIAMITVWLALVCVAPVAAQQRSISLSVTDVDSGKPLPARVYLEDDQGRHFFFSSSSGDSGAVRYNKQNWINNRAIERHTTVSAHPCTAVVPAGSYTLTVEHGKSYFPWVKTLVVSDQDVAVAAKLKRWIDTSDLGWYSGDAHIHRTIDELRNIVLAEDLNVVFPLTNWVTLADTPPSAGDKNINVDLPDKLIHVDEQHVIWPRNTEYEIFSVAGQRHTLGTCLCSATKVR